MHKYIKWDIIDHLKRNYLLYIGMIASLVFALIPEKGNSIWANILILLSGMFGFFLFPTGIVLAVNIGYKWLTRDSYLLDLARPATAWITLLSKMIVATLINLISCLFILQLSTIWNKYSTGEVTFISMETLKWIPGIVLLFLLIDCTIMFSFLLARSIRIFRRMSVFFTGLLSTFLLIGIIAVCMIIMITNDMLFLPSINTKGIFTLSGGLQVLSSVFPVVYFGIVILVEYIFSCLLLKNRFQRDGD